MQIAFLPPKILRNIIFPTFNAFKKSQLLDATDSRQDSPDESASQFGIGIALKKADAIEARARRQALQETLQAR